MTRAKFYFQHFNFDTSYYLIVPFFLIKKKIQNFYVSYSRVSYVKIVIKYTAQKY